MIYLKKQHLHPSNRYIKSLSQLYTNVSIVFRSESVSEQSTDEYVPSEDDEPRRRYESLLLSLIFIIIHS